MMNAGCLRGATPGRRVGVVTLLSLLAFAHSTAAQAEWVFREEAIMGTRCAVELWSEDRAAADRTIDRVFAELRRIDALMSTYKPESPLSQVNARAASGPVKVSPELYKMIETALDYSRISGGAFDITYASVGYLYDFRQHHRPDAATIAADLPGINWRHVVLNPADHSIRYTRPGTRIDLGGIAKGYAVDRGIAILQAAGIKRAMVNGGGDTRIIGDRFGKPWMVGIRDPNRRDGIALRMPIENDAISTSGDYERFFDEGGTRYHHIIDPKTGDSARKLRSATIIASTALQTDALSTTVFVLGPEEGLALINRMKNVDAVVITNDGRVLYSNGLTPE